MKRPITCTLTLLAGVISVHAQGMVTFLNYGAASYIYVSYKPQYGAETPLGGNATGPAPTTSNYGTAAVIADGYNWTVGLYGAVGSDIASGSLGPVSTGDGTPLTANFANGVNVKTPGTWSSTVVGMFPNAPNGTVATIQLVAWYSGTGDTLAQAQAAGLPWGESATANVTLGSPPAPPAMLPTAALGNFTVQTYGFTSVVPEPSSIALGIVGASTFLMRLRRRK